MVARPTLETAQNGHVSPPQSPTPSSVPAPNPPPPTPEATDTRWYHRTEILLLLVTAAGTVVMAVSVVLGYVQYRANTKNEKHKQFQDMLGQLLGNETAWKPN